MDNSSNSIAGLPSNITNEYNNDIYIRTLIPDCNKNFTSCVFTHDESQVVIEIFNHIEIVTGTLGLLGNLLTILVLRSGKFNGSSTATFLKYLALADFIYQILQFIKNYTSIVAYPIRSVRYLCQLLPFWSYSNSWISVWLLVAVSIDRAIWVIFPFRARIFCSMRNVRIAIFSIVIFTSLVASHLLFVKYRCQHGCGGIACYSSNEASLCLYILDLFFVCFFPTLIMTTVNILIINKLKKMKRFRTSTRSNEHSQDESSHLTTMLMASGVFYVITTVPLLSYNLWTHSNNFKTEIDKNILKVTLLENLFTLLWQLNFKMHFVVYFLSGTSFRQETISFVKKCFTFKG